MSRELTKMKKKEEYKWLNDVSRQCVDNSIKNLDVAFNRFFQKKTKYPRFKRKQNKQSFQTSNYFCRMRIRGVQIPHIGVLKCSLDGLPEDYKLISITTSKDPTGKCFAAISFETNIPDPKIDKNKPIIGIDFGLKTFITTSDGQKIEHPQFFKQEEKRLRRYNRRLSRRKEKSRRRRVAKQRIALLHEKIRNRRSDFLHKLSSKMIRENQAIYLEDLCLKGMMGRFGKGIGDIGWREFTRQLEYKGKWYGCKVEKIDRFFPSSKLCSSCGKIKNDLTLSDREWTCPSCQTHHDRDVNAAINVLEYGRADRNPRTGRVADLGHSANRQAKNKASHGKDKI
jgi:putative transposase